MIKVIKQQIRLHARVAAFAVLGIVLGSMLIWRVQLVIQKQQTSPIINDTVVVSEATTTEPYVLERSEPEQLRIPKINLNTSFEGALGVKDSGEIEVPRGFEQVGWYKYAPTPGELGPAVILGHVDSYEGPAVFYSLGQLEVGDRVYVDRVDGTTAVFEVQSLERVSQDDFPTERVYGNLPYAGLRLITCTGVYDRGIRRYSHNLIVYAKLVSEE